MCVYTYVIVVSVLFGVMEYWMVIGERGGIMMVGRCQCRQRAQGDHNNLENYTDKSDIFDVIHRTLLRTSAM